MKNTSEVEIQNISNNGIWLYVNGNEFFLPYIEYPWFKEAKVKEIYNFELLLDEDLHWSDLDIDLEIDSLCNPEKYPF